MSDNRAEQATNQAQKYAQWKRMEFDDVLELLKEKVEERNANTGNLPKLVFRGRSIVELGQYSLHFEFDQLFHSPADFVLVVKVGSDNRSSMALSGSVPPAERHLLQPKVSNDLRSVVWTHNLGCAPFTSSELVAFALDLLIGYYQKYTPK
jgi:hypothetical protein